MSPVEEGVNLCCIREFQRTFFEDFIDGILKKYPLCQCTVFIITPHGLPRLLDVAAFHVENSNDYIGKSCKSPLALLVANSCWKYTCSGFRNLHLLPEQNLGTVILSSLGQTFHTPALWFTHAEQYLQMATKETQRRIYLSMMENFPIFSFWVWI